jgi:4-hydroxybenzoate polyprenyltransferase
MNRLMVILKLMRIKQWIKNGFVAIPFVLSLEFLEINFKNYWHLFIGILCFCLASSAVYIINDLVDRKEDLLHHKKKKRPLADGSISVIFALVLSAFLASLAVSLVVTHFNFKALLIILLYFSNSLLYTLFTKHYAIFDAISISVGFVLRVFFGIFCFETPISKWIILLTFTICLFLAFTKRRKDFMTDGYVRKSLKGYTQVMLDKFIVISSTLAIACYVMYTNEMVNITDNYGFTITNIFVIFGIFRYLQALHLDTADVGDSGIIIYKDMIFLVNLVLWGIALIGCLAFN